MGPPPFGDGNVVDQVDMLLRAGASMGPPPFGDGNKVWTKHEGYPSVCFNGATAFRRWKRLIGLALSSGSARLQWGHRLSAMETVSVASLAKRAGGASMGPPPFGDGNLKVVRVGIYMRRCFNGATAFRRWKRPERRDKHMGGYVLQWGHRLSAMETSLPRPMKTCASSMLQWGHRLSAMETSTW